MKLNLIAADMRANINRPHAQIYEMRTLAHGMQVLLHRENARRWRLALAREDVYPSDTEIAICMQAFGVPEGTEIAKRLQPVYHDKSRRQSTRHIVEMTWIEEPERA